MPRDRLHRTSGRDWLNTGYGWDLGVPQSEAYSWAHLACSDALNAESAWRTWWRGAHRRELWLFPLFTPHAETEPRVRRRLRTVEVVLDMDSACFDGKDRPAQARLAVEHLRQFVGLSGERLRLGPTPCWPILPLVPEDLPEFEYVDDIPDRDEMRGLFRETGVKGDVEEILDGFGYDADGRPPGSR